MQYVENRHRTHDAVDRSFYDAIIIEKSDDEFYTSHSGLALAGLWLNCYNRLSRVIGRKMDNNDNLISNIDIIRSYLGLLCLGKSDYEAITTIRTDDYFKSSFGITNVPSAERDCASGSMKGPTITCQLCKNVRWQC